MPAYNNYYPVNYYNPYNYQPPQMAQTNYQNNAPQVQQIPQAQTQVQPQVQPQAVQNGFIRVQNENEARMYPVAPGNSVTFVDETAPYCYVKTVDVSQLDRPKFDKYRLVKEDTENTASNASKTDFEEINKQLSEYAKKSEMEALKGEIKALKKKIEKLKAKDDEDEESDD